MSRPEILAPAGNREMLGAAVFSGADAVYLGLTGFNARRTAGNFTPDELREAVAFCHARGVKVHVTLNTLVYDRELSGLADAVRAVAAAGADAVIADDLATAQLVKSIAPTLHLHGSTQMSVHTPEGAKELAALGYDRVILARELSLEEIRAVCEASPIEVEVFVHGALCMSVSGQCMMSAFLGGRSGNRGACAGPCRLKTRPAGPCLPFELKGHGLHPAPAGADGSGCRQREDRGPPAHARVRGGSRHSLPCGLRGPALRRKARAGHLLALGLHRRLPDEPQRRQDVRRAHRGRRRGDPRRHAQGTRAVPPRAAARARTL